MEDWLVALADCRRRGSASVLVTVAAVRGSAPRDAGAHMVVYGASIGGTIGGGRLEQEAVAFARALLASGGQPRLLRHALGPSLGQCCGGVVWLRFERVAGDEAWVAELLRFAAAGRAAIMVCGMNDDPLPGRVVVTEEEAEGEPQAADVGALGLAGLLTPAAALARPLLASGLASAVIAEVPFGEGRSARLLFDPLPPPVFRLLLYGAGHVGRALVQVLSGAPCRIDWIDEREESFPSRVPERVRRVAVDTPEAEVDRAPPDACHLVMTHSHALDLRIAERILRRGEFAWFGLIGSASKRESFHRRLLARGVPAASIGRMVCPVGIDGIRDKHPAAIAISIAAQLFQVREQAAAGRAAPGGLPIMASVPATPTDV